jgi:hypothetical protein
MAAITPSVMRALVAKIAVGGLADASNCNVTE